MSASTPSSALKTDQETIRFGIRFLLGLVAAILAVLTGGISAYAYVALDRLQHRMEALAEGNLEEITLAGRLHDATEALLRPIEQMADIPAEVPTTASLNGLHMQFNEVHNLADTLAARLAESGAAEDKARMTATLHGLDATETAVDEFAAAAQRHRDAEKRRRDLVARLEILFDRHLETHMRAENLIRTLVMRSLANDLPEAAGRGQLHPRLESFLEREMQWLTIIQNQRTDARELNAIARLIARENDPVRLAEAQREFKVYTARLSAWRRLPENEGVRALGNAAEALAAALTASPTLPRVRAEELASEIALATSTKSTGQATSRFYEQVGELVKGLSHDVREGVRQTRAEVQRTQAILAVSATFASIIGILLLFGVVAHRIIRPLEKVTASMRSAAYRLSEGRADWQTALNPPTLSGNDEVAAMYRALRVFRDMLVSRQEESERSQAQLRTILVTINEAVLLWDRNGHLVFCNAVARHLLGMATGDPRDNSGSWLYQRDDGTPMSAADFPHCVALRTGVGQTGIVMQVTNPAGVSRWLLVNAQPVFGAVPREILGVVSSCSDITEFKCRQVTLEHLAHHDPLTQLPNRTLLEDRLQHAINQADRNGTLLAVCYLDLDGFKPINDRFGHAAGDLVLQEVARRLKAKLRGGDTVARVGGDEFVLLLAAIDDIAECRRTVQRVLQNLGLPCALYSEPESCACVTASIGVTIYPIDKADANGLLCHADQAMYYAKQSGKNTFHFFPPSIPKFDA